jgi:hypothetical protein
VTEVPELRVPECPERIVEDQGVIASFDNRPRASWWARLFKKEGVR